MQTRADASIVWDVGRGETYADYLGLDLLLAAQRPRSGDHDEMLFIVIHQASELWMKLALHEIGAAIRHLREGALGDALKILARVGRIQQQLIQSWDVLSTMTPHDYLRLRPHLRASSGFQSPQYRELEFLLGNKDARLAEVHRGEGAHWERLQATLAAPSLYDEALRLLARRGIAVPASALERDWAVPYAPSAEVEDAWLAVYQDVERYWELYDLAEKLVDLDDRFQQWRFRHVRTVERVIGLKRGTGGSSGVPYLERALGLRLFPELWSVRTRL
jgi:tryptophan 2,3-dioxygenase